MAEELSPLPRVPFRFAIKQSGQLLRYERIDVNVALVQCMEKAKDMFEDPAILVGSPEMIFPRELSDQVDPFAETGIQNEGAEILGAKSAYFAISIVE